jgi:excisionase family DNA binding protein
MAGDQTGSSPRARAPSKTIFVTRTDTLGILDRCVRCAVRVIDVTEAARVLGVNKSTVYEMANQGTIPAFRVGRLWRFSLTELEAWIAKGGHKGVLEIPPDLRVTKKGEAR